MNMDHKTVFVQQNIIVCISLCTKDIILIKQEGLADAKVSARQQCVYEGP